MSDSALSTETLMDSTTATAELGWIVHPPSGVSQWSSNPSWSPGFLWFCCGAWMLYPTPFEPLSLLQVPGPGLSLPHPTGPLPLIEYQLP